MRFSGYCIVERAVVEFEVKSKIRTDVRGHKTYMLRGVTDRGSNMCTLVNRSQWEKFDVPVEEERFIVRKTDHRAMRNNQLKPSAERRKHRMNLKHDKVVYNEEVERWLAEHYDIDLDKLKDDESRLNDKERQ